MWNELIFTLPPGDVERASAVLTLLNNDGMYIEDFSDLLDNELVRQTMLVEQKLLDKIHNNPVIHLYISPDANPAEISQSARNLLTSAGINHTLEIKEILDADWAEEWKKYYKPVEIGKNLVVVPCWEEYSKTNGKTVVRIDPGAAFGTGTHETTRLCMQAAEQYLTPGARVLDIGTGSGILAVTALLLGAASADAVDIDPLAVRAAAENARLTAVTGRLKIKQGDLLSTASGRYDFIFANIVADVILSLLPVLREYMFPACKVVLSGIINSRAEEVIESASQNGFVVSETSRDGEWTALVIE